MFDPIKVRERLWTGLIVFSLNLGIAVWKHVKRWYSLWALYLLDMRVMIEAIAKSYGAVKVEFIKQVRQSICFAFACLYALISFLWIKLSNWLSIFSYRKRRHMSQCEYYSSGIFSNFHTGEFSCLGLSITLRIFLLLLFTKFDGVSNIPGKQGGCWVKEGTQVNWLFTTFMF